MKSLILTFIAVVTTFASSFAVAAKPSAKGDQIPDITLMTADHADLKLRAAVKMKPAVIVFYRGGWCPYCTRHLMALANAEEDILSAGYQILAISPDQPSKIAGTPDREKLKYTLLSDAKMEAAKAFGISFQVADDLVAKYKNEYRIDIEAFSGENHHLLPHPAVFIVDREGIIRFAHVDADYKVRLDPAEILKNLR